MTRSRMSQPINVMTECDTWWPHYDVSGSCFKFRLEWGVERDRNQRLGGCRRIFGISLVTVAQSWSLIGWWCPWRQTRAHCSISVQVAENRGVKLILPWNVRISFDLKFEILMWIFLQEQIDKISWMSIVQLVSANSNRALARGGQRRVGPEHWSNKRP